jgi:hypothetical protein
MGLLRSVDNVPGIHFYEYREYDYWDKFKYRARCKIPGVRFTYWAKNIDEWKDRVTKGHGIYRSKLSDTEKQLMLNHAQMIEKFIELKNELKKTKQGTIRIEGDTTAVFSNDLTFLHSLQTWMNNVDYTEVQKSQFAGIKYFVNEPKYKFRIYLRSKRVESSLSKELKEFFKKQNSLNPSKALNLWVNLMQSHQWKSRFISSSYFIEYNDEATLSYLALMYPDILGRRYKLEKRPDTV